MRTEKIYSVLLIIFFLSWILVPIFKDSFHFYSEPSISKTENRSLTRKPVFDISFLDPYPAAYEKYYTDHFVFRQKLLEAHSGLIYYPFRRSPIPDQVDIGKDGWLFNGKNDKLIYQGKKWLTGDQIRSIVKILHKRTLYYRNKGIHFYVCFAPMSQEIYPEYLPNNYFRSPGGTQTDKLIAAIHRDTVIPFIDLKPVLLEAKKITRIYQKLDNHWNVIGGFYVYSAIMERMKKDFPMLKPLTKEDVTFTPHIKTGGGLSNMIGSCDVLTEEDYSPVFRHPHATFVQKAGYPPPFWFPFKDEYEIVSAIPDQTMPKLFVVRDSFFNMPMLFFRESFRKTTVIWDSWMYRSNKDLIEKEKPDIVLLMIVEPVIGNILDVPSD